MTPSGSLKIDAFNFEYFLFEGGSRYLIAFHGFGENAGNLSVLLPYVKKKWSVLAINLPFHGNSIPSSKRAKLTSKILVDLVHEMQKKYGFERFALFGYSLGGKVALCLTERLESQIDGLTLLAPDGIAMNRWYNLTIRFALTRKLFQYIIKDPKLFFQFVSSLRRMRLIPPSLEKFVRVNLETRAKREQVYNVWWAHQLLVPKMKVVQQKLISRNIPVQLIFGKYDRVIPPSIGHQFMKNMNGHGTLHIVKAGHQLINPAVLELLA